MKPHIYVMPEEFMADQSVPAHWRMLGILNGFFINHKHVYASNEWFQTQLKCSRPTVSAAVEKLESLGLITLERTKRSRVIKPREASSFTSPRKPTSIPEASSFTPNSVSNAVSIKSAEAPAPVEVVEVADTPTQLRKRVDEPVLEVFRLFAPKYPKIWEVNKTERKAAEILRGSRTLDQIQAAIKFYRENKGTQYCPDVSTPWKLANKWPDLFAFKEKNNL